MADRLTPEQRHRCMSRIRGKNTKPELLLRKALWQAGLRYRLHSANLPGKPDLVFAKAKVAVFIDGCFWHGCPKHTTLPATNREFWQAKIYRNIQRDKEVSAKLQAAGWKTLRFWQHDLKDINDAVQRIRQFVKPASAEDYALYAEYEFKPAYTIADAAAEYQVSNADPTGDDAAP